MSYLYIYDGSSFSCHAYSDFKEKEEYFLGRWSPEYQPDICFGFEFCDMNIRQGRITVYHNNLYYSEGLNRLPAQFNNHIISEETFPIGVTGNIVNVFSFMQRDENNPNEVFPAAFMFSSPETHIWGDYNIYEAFYNKRDRFQNGFFEEWECCDQLKIRGDILESDLVLEDAPYDFLTFYSIEGERDYRLCISEEVQNKFCQVNDDNEVVPFESNSALKPDRTYRFIYDDKYLFIFGGQILLYARL